MVCQTCRKQPHEPTDCSSPISCTCQHRRKASDGTPISTQIAPVGPVAAHPTEIPHSKLEAYPANPARIQR